MQGAKGRQHRLFRRADEADGLYQYLHPVYVTHAAGIWWLERVRY